FSFYLLIHAIAMKIAVAYGVWPFKGQKIIILAALSAQVKEHRRRKSVFNCFVHACMNGLFFRTTGKLQEDYKS
ncbi:TPA: hypothetical protein ACJFMM_004527, partial [Escherichia coli]